MADDFTSFQRETPNAVTVELAQNKSDVLVETTLYNALFMDRYLYNTYFRNEVPSTSIDSLHEATILLWNTQTIGL
jgi:hypothetical protein